MAVALRELLAKFGFEVDDSKLKAAGVAIAAAAVSMKGLVAKAKETSDETQGTGEKVKKNLDMKDVVKSVQAFGAAWAANAVVQRVASFARELEQVGSELQDTSTQLGISSDSLQRWRYIAGQNGASAQDMSNGFAFLQRSMFAAANGSKSHSAIFKRLGVDIKDANGNMRPTSEVMMDVGLGLSRLDDDASRTAIAMQVFGRGGRALIPMFAQGEEGVRALSAEFDALGGGMSNEGKDATDAYGDSVMRLDVAMLALKTTIGTSLFPALTWLINKFAFATGWLSKATKAGHELEIVMGLLGVAAARAAWRFVAAWASALWPVALAAAAIGVVTLVVGDLIGMFEGKKSVIGTFIDELWGIGTTKQVVTDLTDAWQGFMMTLEWIGEKISEVFGKVAGVGAAVRSAFSGSMSGGVLGTLRDAVSTADIARSGGAVATRGAPPSVSARIPVSSRAGASVSTVNNITVQGSDDPRAVANAVMRRVNEQRDSDYRAALVAAGGEGD